MVVKPTVVTDDSFKAEVLDSEIPVLVDFWAPWCGPCRMVGPVIDSIAEEVTHAKVGKVNVDEQQELARKFNVMSIPTILVIKDGKEAKRSIGAIPKQEILTLLK